MELGYLIFIFLTLQGMGHCKLEDVKREVSLEKFHCTVNKTKDHSIFHFKAQIEGKSDTVHYIVSAIDTPTIIVAHSEVPSKLAINCPKILTRKPGGIIFAPPVNTSGAFVFSKLIEYEDKDDTVKLSNVIHDVLKNFSWHTVSSNSDSIQFFANSSKLRGHLGFEVKVFDSSGFDTKLPREPYNSNSSRFNLWLDGLNVTTEKSRFAVELTFLVDADKDHKIPAFKTAKSIDDEHTPGIFKLIKLNISSENGGTFASWKPVAYSEDDRSRKNQVLVHYLPSKDGSLDMSLSRPKSIADSFMKRPQAYGMNFTMGLTADQFYKNTKYIGWTGLVGYGTPPYDSVSTMVIIIISVGLGLPAFLFLFGGMALCVKRCCGQKNLQYQQIN